MLHFAYATSSAIFDLRYGTISSSRPYSANAMRLNYQHLLYFWTVVRTGSLTRACEELRLSAPTVSTQLRLLEERLGEKLLARSGRTLVPTDTGRIVFRYAEDIFGLGRELVDTLKGRPTGRPLRLVIGIDDVLPKEIAHRLIKPERWRRLSSGRQDEADRRRAADSVRVR